MSDIKNKLWIPLYVCGEHHKSLFSTSPVPAWICKTVAKNATMQLSTENCSVELPGSLANKIVHPNEQGGTGTGDGLSAPVKACFSMPYLSPAVQADSSELTRLAFPRKSFKRLKIQLRSAMQLPSQPILLRQEVLPTGQDARSIC